LIYEFFSFHYVPKTEHLFLVLKNLRYYFLFA